MAKLSTSACERGSRSIRRTCRSSTAGLPTACRLTARSSSSSSGMLLHRKNDSRDARSRSLDADTAVPGSERSRARARRGTGSSAPTGCGAARAGCPRRSRRRRGPPCRKSSSVLHLGVRDRAAIGAARERGQNRRRARLLGSRACRRWPADEDLPAARRVRPRATALVRPADEHRVDGRIAEVQLVGRAGEAALRRLQHAFGLPVLADERHADLARPRFHRHTHLEARVGGVHVDFPLADRPACCRRSSRAPSCPCLRRRS